MELALREIYSLHPARVTGMQQVGDPALASAQHTALLARLLTANLRDLVVWLRADGERLFMSDAVTEILGWTRDEATAMPPLAMVDPADRAQIQQALTRLFTEGGEAIATFRGCHKDGREIWLEALGRWNENVGRSLSMANASVGRQKAEPCPSWSWMPRAMLRR